MGLGRLDPAEHRVEARRAHEGEHPLVLGDVEGRLAGETERIAIAGLPLDQVRQELLGGLLIRDEVVVHEVDGDRAGRHDLVQLAQNLLRRLEPRIAAVQPGNVAELARVRAAARELDARDEVLSQPDEGVRGHGKVRHGQPLHRLEADLTRRAAVVGVEVLEEPVGAVAQLAQMQHVGLGIVLGAAGRRGPPHRHGPALRMRPRDHVVDVAALDVHARHEDRVGPPEVACGGSARALVHEAHLP